MGQSIDHDDCVIHTYISAKTNKIKQVALQLLLLPSSVLFDALAISGQARATQLPEPTQTLPHTEPPTIKPPTPPTPKQQALVADCLGRHALARAAKLGRVLLSYGLSFGAALSLQYLLGGVPSFITEDAAVLAKVC